MRKTIFLILLTLLIITGCGQPQQINTSSTNTSTSTASKCDSYTSSYNIQRCKAIEAEDLSMCDPITKYATREDCIMVIAELVQDQSQLSDCSLSQNSNYKIICQALIKKDVSHCFTMQESLSGSSDLAMRDCIELVARKLKDKTVCQNFITHAETLEKVCGSSTSDCEGLWIDGASSNKEDCESIIEEQT